MDSCIYIVLANAYLEWASTTRKIAFYDAQSMTRADRGHTFERALKIDVSFPKYEA